MQFTLWLTGRCNLSCKYCYVDKAKNHLDFDENQMESLMAFIQKRYLQDEKIYFNFFGGEPLLRFDLIQKIVDRMERQFGPDVIFLMTTNGLLLDEKKMAFLVEHKFRVSLSWDGCKEANDLNRVSVNGSGTYDQIRRSYMLLKDSNLESVRVRGTFTSKTYQYLEQSAQEFAEIDPWMSVFFAPDYFDPAWNEESLNKVAEIRDRVREQYPNVGIVGEEDQCRSRCGGGETSFNVYMDGTVYPCSLVTGDEKFCIGTIQDGIRQETFKKLAKHYCEKLVGCEGCDNEPYCLSNKCRYLNWLLTGSPQVASPVVCHFENIKRAVC